MLEKINGEYVYQFWVNTEGYPALDADKISPDNAYYFQKFYQTFDEVVKKQGIAFRILGIGVEANFQYERNNADVIKKSENIMSWIGNKALRNDMALGDYRERESVGMDFYIFER